MIKFNGRVVGLMAISSHGVFTSPPTPSLGAELGQEGGTRAWELLHPSPYLHQINLLCRRAGTHLKSQGR